MLFNDFFINFYLVFKGYIKCFLFDFYIIKVIGKYLFYLVNNVFLFKK